MISYFDGFENTYPAVLADRFSSCFLRLCVCFLIFLNLYLFCGISCYYSVWSSSRDRDQWKKLRHNPIELNGTIFHMKFDCIHAYFGLII